MGIRRTTAFTKRNLARFVHDPRTLAFVLVMPILMIAIFGYTFGGEPKSLRVAVVDLDEGAPHDGEIFSLAQSVIDSLDTDTFVVDGYQSREKALLALEDADVWAVIYFPSNFTGNFVAYVSGSGAQAARISLDLDDTNPSVASALSQGLRAALIAAHDDAAQKFDFPEEVEPVVVDVAGIYSEGEEVEFIDYFSPGVISFAVMMVTTMLTIILFVGEKRHGTMDRLAASPASESEIVVGYALAFALLALLQTLVALGTAVLLFNITIKGSVLLAIGVALLLGIGHQGFGILLSAGAKNELQAVQFIPLILFPSILLSGLFWPVESIPKVLQPISYVVPLRYAIDAERSVMLKGWSAGDVWLDLSVLAAFAVLTLAASVVLLKRRS